MYGVFLFQHFESVRQTNSRVKMRSVYQIFLYVIKTMTAEIILMKKAVYVSIHPVNMSTVYPVSTIHLPNVDLMLCQRRRRWPNIKSTLG